MDRSKLARELIDPRDHPLLERVPARTLRQWLESGRLKGYRRGVKWQTTVIDIERFFEACNKGRIPRAKAKAFILSDILENRAEQAQTEFPGQPAAFWGRLFKHLFPEIFGRGLSRKACNVTHGTSSARWRLKDRASKMLDLEHPRDSNGIPEANRPPKSGG